jgi:hypothetical protein
MRSRKTPKLAATSLAPLPAAPEEDLPSPWTRSAAREAPDPELPVLELKPLDDHDVRPAKTRWAVRFAQALGTAASRIISQLQRTGRTASEWRKSLSRREARPSSWAHEGGDASGGVTEIKAQPSMAPPALRDLPVIRLAPTNDREEETNDVYDGEYGDYDGPSIFETVWLWVKRLTVITGLVLGGIIAVDTWEAWVPTTAKFARGMFLEVDKRVHPTTGKKEEGEEPQPIRHALQAATEQVPQLAPETIALLMSNSVGGILEPPEVFRRACAATERGMSALTTEEAQELKTLRGAMYAALPPPERERIREYDLVRGQRVTLPFEDREALRLVARGTRSLTPEARERVQSLTGKAIAASFRKAEDPAPAAATVH